MESFKDAAAEYPAMPASVHIETEFIPIAFLQRFQKHFPIRNVLSLDFLIASVRAVKSNFELDLMRKSGELHRHILEDWVPGILHEGMSEVDLAGALYAEMLRAGHHGVARFGMLIAEVVLGHIAFGESSLYPTSFNGPGGNYGMGPAVPGLAIEKHSSTKETLFLLTLALALKGTTPIKPKLTSLGEEPQPKSFRNTGHVWISRTAWRNN